MTHDYKRHGATTLFAAMNVKTGEVIGECLPRHRAKEFIKFLIKIDTAVCQRPSPPVRFMTRRNDRASQFVANMSHELRTPLAAILGYAELMQEGFYETQSNKSIDALTRIRSNGKHLLGLINTVLDIAKIKSGQFSLNVGEYALESVVETVRSATKSLAETKKLALKTDVAKRLPVGLGDEQRLTQVLLNLVGNAIKFTDTGEVRITATAMNGRFTIAVTDTGPGIPPEELEARLRAVSPDRQLQHQSEGRNRPRPRDRQADRRDARWAHLGRVDAGKGATFQMKLLFAPNPQGRAMTKRILVVEDQADLRGILRDLLTGSGYEVAEAADGREGVAKAKSERPISSSWTSSYPSSTATRLHGRSRLTLTSRQLQSLRSARMR